MRHAVLRAALLAALALCASRPAGAQAPAPPTVHVTALMPVEQFFEPASLSGASLSPDGRQLAMRVTPAEGHERLAVLDLASMRSTTVAAFSDADIGDFLWVNDRRLAFRLTDRTQGRAPTPYGSGLYAVDSDGGALRQLATRMQAPQRPAAGRGGESQTLDLKPMQGETHAKAGRPLLPYNTVLMDSIGEQRGNDVFALQVQRGEFGAALAASLWRVDSVSGSYAPVDAPAHVRYWLYDHGGQARIATAQQGGQNLVYWRMPGTEQWQLLAQFDPRSDGPEVFEPAFLAPDGSLYVTARNGGDKAALYRYDLHTRQRDAQPLVSSPTHDIDASMLRSDTALLGIRYTTDTEVTLWLDADMQAVQRRVDALLPATTNTVSVGTRSSTPFVLVASWSDTQPAIYRIFHRDTGQLTPLARSRPAVNAERMAGRQLRHYRARDALRIPAWLTLPRTGPRSALPLILFVHDGPWQRSTPGWQGASQFLASRGYAVLEPDYRGSTGLGAAHFRAGWQQWGLAMQDDLADGVRWAVAEGIADPQRVCIIGAGYGGYAALMGLAKDGDLYRCGVAWSAATDLAAIADGRWRVGATLYEGYDRYPAASQIGDARRDAARLRATSPRYLAQHITRPLLLAHGYRDHVVPLSDAYALYQAIRQGNPDAQWLRHDDEGQDWRLTKNRIDFWQRVEQFLARHNAPAHP